MHEYYETHEDPEPRCAQGYCCGCDEHPIGKPWGWNVRRWEDHYAQHHASQYDIEAIRTRLEAVEHNSVGELYMDAVTLLAEVDRLRNWEQVGRDLAGRNAQLATELLNCKNERHSCA